MRLLIRNRNQSICRHSPPAPATASVGGRGLRAKNAGTNTPHQLVTYPPEAKTEKFCLTKFAGSRVVSHVCAGQRCAAAGFSDTAKTEDVRFYDRIAGPWRWPAAAWLSRGTIRNAGPTQVRGGPLPSIDVVDARRGPAGRAWSTFLPSAVARLPDDFPYVGVVRSYAHALQLLYDTADRVLL
jgi:hypothetical protein